MNTEINYDKLLENFFGLLNDKTYNNALIMLMRIFTYVSDKDLKPYISKFDDLTQKSFDCIKQEINNIDDFNSAELFSIGLMVSFVLLYHFSKPFAEIYEELKEIM